MVAKHYIIVSNATNTKIKLLLVSQDLLFFGVIFFNLFLFQQSTLYITRTKDLHS